MHALVLDAVGAFLVQHGLGFASIVLTALLTAAATVYFQARSKSRTEHLNAIKTNILGPTLNQLETFYLPLLRGDLSPITVDRNLEPVEGSITEPRQLWTARLATRRPDSVQAPSVWFGDDPEPRPEIDSALYDHAKRRHYKKLLRELDSFRSAVDAHTSRVVNEAEQLSRIILQESKLPSYREQAPLISGSGTSCDSGLGIAGLPRCRASQANLFL